VLAQRRAPWGGSRVVGAEVLGHLLHAHVTATMDQRCSHQTPSVFLIEKAWRNRVWWGGCFCVARAGARKQKTASVWESLSIQVLPGPPTQGGDGSSIVVVDNRNEIRQFLTSRRARITPEQAGLPTYGGNRRVAGLRREVALLAGVSVDYYTRLERVS
jgi:hypothetical protein